jgi:uracil-DNA glycosylase
MNYLIQTLAEFESPNVFNPWREAERLLDGSATAPLRRQERLAAHFDCKPRYLLIGEAPGYQGCRFSGVPFTSERLIVEGKIPRVTAGRFTTREKPWSEPSATIVWGALHELGIAETTVLWNAFAWHPHQPGVSLSNRTPTDDEVLGGRDVLGAILERFKGATVVSVGKKSWRLLMSFGITPHEVRHPANGGATRFRRELAEIVRRNATTGELIETKQQETAE